MKGYDLKVVSTTMEEIDGVTKEIEKIGGFRHTLRYSEEEDVYTAKFFLNINTRFVI